MTELAQRPVSRPLTDQKSMLYCTECDHASPADGDWQHRSRGNTVAYVCPVCGTTISERPREHATSLSQLVSSSMEYWRASYAAGVWPVTAALRYHQRVSGEQEQPAEL